MARPPETDEPIQETDPHADHPALQLTWDALPQAMRYAQGWNLQCFAQGLSGLEGDADRTPCSRSDAGQHAFARLICDEAISGRRLSLPGVRLHGRATNPTEVVAAMRGWRLCAAHEELFAGPDHEGNWFARAVFNSRSIAFGMESVASGTKVDGPMLERWFLKLHCDLLSTRGAFDKAAGLFQSFPREWLEILAGSRKMLPDVGLYFAGIDSELFAQPQPSIRTRRLMGTWGTEFVFWGVRFAFIMRPPHPSPDWATGHAPRSILARLGQERFCIRIAGDKFANGLTFDVTKGRAWLQGPEEPHGFPVIVERKSGKITPVFESAEDAAKREAFDQKIQEYRQREDDEYRRVNGEEPPPWPRSLSKEELIATGAREPDPPADFKLRGAAQALAAEYGLDEKVVVSLLEHLRDSSPSQTEQATESPFFLGIRSYPDFIMSRALAAARRQGYPAKTLLGLLETDGRMMAYRAVQVEEVVKDRIGGLFATRRELSDLLFRFATYLRSRQVDLIESGYPDVPFKDSSFLASICFAYPCTPQGDESTRWFSPEIEDLARQAREPTLRVMIEIASMAAKTLKDASVGPDVFWKRLKALLNDHMGKISSEVLNKLHGANESRRAQAIPAYPFAFANALTVARHCEWEIENGIIGTTRQWFLDKAKATGSAQYWDLVAIVGADKVNPVVDNLLEALSHGYTEYSETWDAKIEDYFATEFEIDRDLGARSIASGNQLPALRRAAENAVALLREEQRRESMPKAQLAVFVLQEGRFSISFGGASFSIGPLKGMFYLQQLVANPNVPIQAKALWDLAIDQRHDSNEDQGLDTDYSATMQTSEGSLPSTDRQTIKDALQRQAQIDLELQQAVASKDHDAVKKLEREHDGIERYLKQATDSEGRPRKERGTSGRSRTSVSNAINRAIETIRETNQDLAEHFRASLKLGSTVAYAPSGAVSWQTRGSMPENV